MKNTDSDVSVTRDDTLTSSMDNVLAWRLGEAFSKTSKATAGDYIDRGLALRRELEDAGFGLVKLTEDHFFIGQHPRHRLQSDTAKDARIEALEAENARINDLLAETIGYVHGNHDEGCEFDIDYGRQAFEHRMERDDPDGDLDAKWPADAKCNCGTDELSARIDALLKDTEQ